MLMPGGGPGPQYTGNPERTIKSLGPDLEFWELDPEPFLDDPSGIRVALQQRKRNSASPRATTSRTTPTSS